MLTPEFKFFARKLNDALVGEGYHLNTYELLNVAEALFVQPVGRDYASHEGRVQAALASPVVMAEMRNGRKIRAIKELRAVTLCGLKEAKDAVEDYRVMVDYPGAQV